MVNEKGPKQVKPRKAGLRLYPYQPWDWYFYLREWLIFMVMYMDPMGLVCLGKHDTMPFRAFITLSQYDWRQKTAPHNKKQQNTFSQWIYHTCTYGKLTYINDGF